MAPAASRRGRVAVAVAAVIAIAVVGLLAYAGGRLSVLADVAPTDTSAEAGFARDMQTHHQQGAEMAMLIRDRTDDADVRTLAYDIAITQGQQSGQLFGWLRTWGLSQAGSEPTMTWMSRPAAAGDHEHATASHTAGRMPGMATPAQLAELRDASGVEAERLFLTLMIAHHEGALEMAEAVLDRSTNDTVTTFARSVVESQRSEIDLMRGMLAERDPASPVVVP